MEYGLKYSCVDQQGGDLQNFFIRPIHAYIYSITSITKEKQKTNKQKNPNTPIWGEHKF